VQLVGRLYVYRSGKHGTLTVRTDDEADDVKTGLSPGTYSVLDLTYNTKFYVGGVVQQAVDTVRCFTAHTHICSLVDRTFVSPDDDERWSDLYRYSRLSISVLVLVFCH